MSNFFSRKAAEATVIAEEIKAVHSFYPLGIEIRNHVPNTKEALELLTVFLGGWVVILAVSWWAAGKYSPRLPKLDKTILLWFILTGTIHLFFEGYFSLNHHHLASKTTWFGQLWKEYALSDSRYLTSDAFTLCMETVTAFCWGPMSFLIVYFIAVSHPLRYPFQAIVSLGQIYGLVLYYGTCMFDHYYKNVTYGRPEPYYFWFYFFFMNFIWMVIPGALLVQSVVETGKAFAALQRMSKTIQGNGAARKPKAGSHAKNA